MRCVVVIVIALTVSACSGGSRTATAPTPAPAVVVVQTPTPAPTVANYAGRYSGSYIVDQCFGSSGSMGDVLCSAPHGNNPSGGVFQPGVVKPMALELTQTGSSVSGVLTLGLTRGNVNGSVQSNGALFLGGGTTGGDSGVIVTTTLTAWSASISGSQLSGSIGLGVKVNVYPGDGSITARMSMAR